MPALDLKGAVSGASVWSPVGFLWRGAFPALRAAPAASSAHLVARSEPLAGDGKGALREDPR